MPKFHMEVTYDLSADVEPDGYLAGIGEADVEDFEENSSFYGESVRVSGGTVGFVIEADDEAEAVQKSRDLMDNASFDSYSSFEWEVSDVDVIVLERIEDELDLATAIQVIKNFLARMIAEGRVDDQTGAAFTLVLEALSALSGEPKITAVERV